MDTLCSYMDSSLDAINKCLLFYGTMIVLHWKIIDRTSLYTADSYMNILLHVLFENVFCSAFACV